MSIIKRVEDFGSGKVNCLTCDKQLTLEFNGGELDRVTCCGLIYETVIIQVDLVIHTSEHDDIWEDLEKSNKETQ